MTELTRITLPNDGDSSGRDLGDAELALLAEAVRSGHLTSTRGTMVAALEEAFACRFGVPHAFAIANGSAAVQAAVAALDPEVGDEFITTPITDMGAIAAILYQGCLPRFADVDPETGNVSAETIAQQIGPHSRAIIVTHLFGNPCEMGRIMALAQAHGLPVIEDCAQAFLAEHDHQLVGTIGDIGCFSFQQGKHMTTGEGGIVICRDDALARRIFLFINKAWGYGDSNPDHYFLAPNYRLSELQGAVARAQLAKLDGVVARRQAAAARMDELLADLAGFATPQIAPDSTHVYWKYCLRMRAAGPVRNLSGFANRLRERGIASAPRYIQKPAFACQVIREQVTFGKSRWPWAGAHMVGREPVVYDPAAFPGAYDYLEHILVLPWNERYSEQHLVALSDALHEAEAHFMKEGR